MVVSIKEILYEDQTVALPYSKMVLSLRDTMTALHRGRQEFRDWLYVIPEWKGVKKQQEVPDEDDKRSGW